MKNCIFTFLLAGICCLACQRDPEPEAAQPQLSALSAQVRGAWYHAVIDQQARRIEIGAITQPNTTDYVSAVDFVLAPGASITTDFKLLYGRWQKENEITLITADGVSETWTLVFTQAPEGVSLPSRKWVSPWYTSAMPNWTDVEPYKDRLHIINQGTAIADREFLDACHDAGIQVYYLTGGGGMVDFNLNTMLTDAQAAETYASDFAEAIVASGYDGVNIDIEGVKAEHRAGFSRLLTLLSEALHRVGKGFSICSHNYDPGGFDATVINSVCDYIFIMMYDAYYAGTPYTGGTMGHTAPYSWAQTRMNSDYIAQLDLSKTVFGLPAYSNYWERHITSGLINGHQYSPSFEPPVPPIWNATDRYNYYEWTTQNGWLMKLYATDEQSTAELLTLMDQSGVREIAFWRFRLISPAMWNKIDEWLER
jgi:spore germination protein YaaH